jgi:predicted nucleotidyltransferase
MRSSGKEEQGRVEDLLAACRDALRQLDFPQVMAAYVYGSVLTDGLRLDSDLDVAILDQPENPLGFPDQARLMDALERATGHNVDLRMLRELNPSHSAHVLATGRLVSEPAQSEDMERFRRQVNATARAHKAEVERAWPRLLGSLVELAPDR